jgi:hypothetical protein
MEDCATVSPTYLWVLLDFLDGGNVEKPNLIGQIPHVQGSNAGPVVGNNNDVVQH